MDALNLNCSLKRMFCDGGIHAAVMLKERKMDWPLKIFIFLINYIYFLMWLSESVYAYLNSSLKILKLTII